MVISMMWKCIGVNMFPGEYYLEKEPGPSYVILLIKMH